MNTSLYVQQGACPHGPGEAVGAVLADVRGAEAAVLNSHLLGHLLDSSPPFCQEVKICHFSNKSTFRNNLSNPFKIPHEKLGFPGRVAR